MGTRTFRSTVAVLSSVLLLSARGARGDGEKYDPLGNDDRYLGVLAGKTLVEGEGFPGLFEIGSAAYDKYVLMGNGREEMGFDFWYFHDKGPWTLVIACENDRARDTRNRISIRSIYVEGAGAPPTSKGVQIGDPESKVVEAYGADSTTWRGTIDGFSPKRWVGSGPAPDASRLEAIERPFREGRYYPKIRTIFAMKEQKVFRIAVVRGDDPDALWLRPVPDRTKPQGVVTDPKAEVPRIEGREGGARGTVIVPPVPPLTSARAAGLSLSVPEGWVEKDGRFSAPTGLDYVEVRALERDPAVGIERWLGAEFRALERDDQWPLFHKPSAGFCALVGVDEARAHRTDLATGSKDGWVLRSYTLLLRKGDRAWRLRVARTAMSERESPDGLELARRVFQTVRVSP